MKTAGTEGGQPSDKVFTVYTTAAAVKAARATGKMGEKLVNWSSSSGVVVMWLGLVWVLSENLILNVL